MLTCDLFLPKQKLNKEAKIQFLYLRTANLLTNGQKIPTYSEKQHGDCEYDCNNDSNTNS